MDHTEQDTDNAVTFASLGLSDDLVQAVARKGYTKPSPIQEKAIPAVLAGHDVMAAAQTGTGKTAGFTLPLLQGLKGKRAKPNSCKALILTPTRELAAQVAESVQEYGRNTGLRSFVVFGGVKINPQMMRLRKGVDILIATPGRLWDLYEHNAVSFDELEVFILDEADRMLDMGFIHDIKRIISVIPKQRQNLLFSATFSPEIRELGKRLVNNPVEISVAPANSAANTVRQWLHPVDKKDKTALLIHLVQEHKWFQVLVFSRTKHGANKITKQLNAAGIKSLAIHGNKSQSARTKALKEFKDSSIQVLVATDIAARGLDISQLPIVINFDLPQVAEDYVHRIGRTGRAGADGLAVSLVAADEIKLLQDIEYVIQKPVEREFVSGFEPLHALPASRSIKPTKPKKAKKPKKNKPQQTKSDSSKKKEPSKKRTPNPWESSKRSAKSGKPSSSKSSRNKNSTNKRKNTSNSTRTPK